MDRETRREIRGHGQRLASYDAEKVLMDALRVKLMKLYARTHRTINQGGVRRRVVLRNSQKNAQAREIINKALGGELPDIRADVRNQVELFDITILRDMEGEAEQGNGETAAAIAAAALLLRVRVGGRTVANVLRESRRNSINVITGAFRNGVLAGMSEALFGTQLDQVLRTRGRQVLNTLGNIMTAVRGEARNVVVRTSRNNGTWYNVGVLDGATTRVCIEHMTLSWRLPYAQIPNKPPRVPPPHPCRSFLRWVPDGEEFTPEPSFMEQFDASEELRRDLLTKEKFEALERGDIAPIRSFRDYLRVIIQPLDALI